MLTDVQKACRDETSASFLSLFNANPDKFNSRFVTVDETWLHQFDLESNLPPPPPRKFRVVASARKVMATVFWNSEGTALTDYLEQGRTITGTYYADLIRKCRAALKEKRQESCDELYCFITCWYVITSSDCHPNCGFKLLIHLSYSPDLSPSNFCLFSKLEKNHEKMEI